MITLTISRKGQGWLVLALASALVACGGGSSSDDPNPPPPPPPPPTTVQLSVADNSITEGDSGSVALTFSITLSTAASSAVTVDYTTADGSALAGSDYQAANGTLTIATGSTMASLDINIIGDTSVESDENFSVQFSNISSNATMSNTSATGTIVDNDIAPPPPPPPPPSGSPGSALNDSGQTSCATDVADQLLCNDSGSGTNQYPNQDAERGRDVTDNDDSDGAAGFSFLKLDVSGMPLTDQSVDYATTPWACVEDQVTGLIWEIKTNDGGLHDSAWTYSWYREFGRELGVENGGVCVDTLHCDTEKFAQEVNDENFCGAANWRLPKPQELISIMHFGASANPFIDTNYFPNTASIGYWSNKVSDDQTAMGYVNFDNQSSSFGLPHIGLSLRLVREAQ